MSCFKSFCVFLSAVLFNVLKQVHMYLSLILTLGRGGGPTQSCNPTAPDFDKLGMRLKKKKKKNPGTFKKTLQRCFVVKLQKCLTKL